MIALAIIALIGGALGWGICLFALGEDGDRCRNLAREWQEKRHG